MSVNQLIYFNNNGSTAIHPEVQAAMQLAQELDPALVLTKTKTLLAELVGGNADEMLITAGTTEAIEKGIHLGYQHVKSTRPHIVSCVTEHPAVLDTLKKLQEQGAIVEFLSVDREGLADPDEFRELIRNDTGMLCLMAANNETGAMHPLEEFASICREHGILFFSDGSQYVAKLRCDVKDTGFDLLAFGSHKMYGPQGIGALYANKRLHPAQYSVPVLNNSQIAGFGEAAKIFMRDHWELASELSRLRGYLEHQLLDLPGFVINGSTRRRIYNTSNFSLPNTVDIAALAKKFKFLDYATRTSHVLQAMQISDERISRSCRISLGRYNSLEEIKLFVKETGIYEER
jgi:cysteine desulfurase